MNKPRIKKTGFCTYGVRVWVCVGSGGFGQGESPYLAYQAWARYVRFYGKPGAPQ